MDFESGKTYLVKHQRKGTFAVRVSHQRGEFTYGVIVGGKQLPLWLIMRSRQVMKLASAQILLIVL